MKITFILFSLFFSFLAFSGDDDPEEYCSLPPYYGYINCTSDDPDADAPDFPNRKCTHYWEKSKIEIDGEDVENKVRKENSDLARRKEYCEKLEKEKKEAAEKKIEEAKEELDRQDELERQKQAMMSESQAECRGQYEELRGERNRIEDAVKRIESEIDKRRQEIIDTHIATSQEEDNIKNNLTRLKDRNRKFLRDWEEKRDGRLRIRDDRFKAAEIEIERALRQLEMAEAGKHAACTERFNKYDIEKNSCYDEALAEVGKERDEFYTNLYSGKQKFQSASEVFSNNFKMTEKKFTRLLKKKEKKCYKKRMGKTKVVACNLDTLEKRDKFCQKENPDSRCPTPKAVEFENTLREKLAGISVAKKTADENLARLYKEIGELPGEKEKDLKKLRQELEDEKEKFDEQYTQMSKKLEENQLLRFQKVKKLQEEIQRLMTEDPARHYKEELELAVHYCCPQGFMRPGNPVLCRQINNALTDASRLQFLFIKEEPVKRAPLPVSGSGSR